MSVKLLRSVSAIAISASLAMPSPIIAQTAVEAPQAELCPDGTEPVAQEGSELPVCPENEQAESEASVEGSAESTADEAEPSAEAAVEAESGVETGAETGAESEATAAEESATPAEEPAPPETTATDDATVTEQSTADAEAEVTEEAAPAEAETAADPEEQSEETAAEAEAEPTAEELPAEAEPAQTEEAAAEELPAEAEPAETEAAETVAPTEAKPAAPTEAEIAAPTEAAEAPQAETETGGTGDATGEAAAEVVQDDTVETTAEANQAVQTEAAAAAAEDPDAAEVETDNVETVTEETARSSNEEFATAATAPTQERSGLSNFEKFALGALGVAAVATILNRNDEVVVSSDDRLVVRDERGNYRVLKNDDELLRRPGSQVATREYSDGSTRTEVTREDGARVVTIRAPDGQVLKRTRILPDGREIVLFDDTADIEPVEMSFLRQHRPAERTVDANDPDALRAALMKLENPTGRSYSLQQVRQIRAVRELVPEIDLDEVNFETGSAVIRPEEASDLSAIGKAIAAAIKDNPNEVFLIEGHTDAVGGAAMNLALSDRRAESAALALTEYFDIPPENLVVQGYGEANLKIRTNLAERENRRVAVRRITPLLTAQR